MKDMHAAYKIPITKTTKTLAKKFGGTTNFLVEGTWVNIEDFNTVTI